MTSMTNTKPTWSMRAACQAGMVTAAMAAAVVVGIGATANAQAQPPAPVPVQSKAQVSVPQAELVQATDPLDRAITAAYQLLDAEQWERAEAAFLRLVRDYPNRAEPFYHLACCYCRWAQKLDGAARDEKLRLGAANLRNSARHGWTNLNHMESDPDLELLRDTDDYREAVEMVQRNQTGTARPGNVQPLAYQVHVPSRLPAGRVPAIVYAHETGSTPGVSVRRLAPFCDRQGIILIALEAPVSIQESPDRLFGWQDFSELRIVMTIRRVLTETVGSRIDPRRIILAGNRQGAHFALSAALVDPSLAHAVLLVNSPVDRFTYPDDRVRAVAGKVRLYALHSTSDLLGIAGARQAFAHFRTLGVDARFHEIAAGPSPENRLPDHLRDFLDWFERN